MAKDIAELKAVSQNLIHGNISTTDGIYGNLSNTDLRERIGSLGQRVAQDKNHDVSKLIELVKRLEEKIGK